MRSLIDSEGSKQPTSTARFWGLPKNVFFLGFVSLLTDLSSEVAIRTLPLFLANVLGIKASVIGLIEGVADSTATLTRLLSGWLSDRLGKRKVLVTTGYGLSTFVKPVLYFATSWWHILIVRFLDRVGKGVRTAPRDALIADSCTPAERGRAFGFNKAMDPAGAMAGLAVAAVIVYFSQGGSLGLTRLTYHYLVLLAVIPALLSFLLLVAFVRDVAPVTKSLDTMPDADGRVLNPNFKRYLAVLIFFTLGNSSDAFLMLRAQNLGMSIGEIFALLAVFNLVSAVCSYPAGRLSDRLGRKSLISAGWLIYAGVYLGFAVATSAAHVWALYLIYGVYEGLTAGVEKAFVADLVPGHVRGTAYGFYNTAIGISALPASLIAGVLWQAISPPAPFVFGAALAFAGFIGLNVMVKKGPQASQPQ
ncbi:MAG: MFS transporter [Pyrinomonadaceae bacterium]